MILPVFAGMARAVRVMMPPGSYFPRIRGDGPARALKGELTGFIFPVFAGMILGSPQPCYFPPHSPRIRGDNLSANSTE